MTEWFEKINEDYNKQRTIDELKERFYILGEGKHDIVIDLSTKDKLTINPEGQKPRTYTLFNTIGCEQPVLRLTNFQYGLLLKKLGMLPGFKDGEINKKVKIIAMVTKDENDKLKFDMSIIPGDPSDYD